MKTLTLPITTSLLFAGSFVAARYATFELEPFTITLFRYAVALIFLWSLAVIRKSELKIEAPDIFQMALLGLFGIIGYHYLFFVSLMHTTVANTAIINASSPVLTALATAMFAGERLKRRNYLGLLLTFTGVLVLISQGRFEVLAGLSFAFGDLLMLGAVLCWVVYALLIQRLIKRYDGFVLTFYATLSAVVMLIFPSLMEDPVRQLKGVSTAGFIGIVYMGVGASGLGYLYYNKSIKVMGPTKTSGVVYSLVPVLVAVLALLFFGEPISVIMVASVALILSGLRLMLS